MPCMNSWRRWKRKKYSIHTIDRQHDCDRTRRRSGERLESPPEKNMKKLLSLILTLVLTLAMFAGLAEEEALTAWNYVFTPGELLTGEGMQPVNELLTALELELTSQKTDGAVLGRLVLFSEGNKAFELRAREEADGTYGIACSLLGECTLLCHKDQLDDFLITLAQALGEMGILKGSSLDRVTGLAGKVGRWVESTLTLEDGTRPEAGIDLNAYVNALSGLASDQQEQMLAEPDPQVPGAVRVRTWYLTEKDLNRLVNAALGKLGSIPVVSDELKSGRLQIEGQVITDDFIRELFASMHGETTLTIYEDAEGDLLRLSLDSPDISHLVVASEFGKTRGVEIVIERGTLEDGREQSLTEIRLKGLEGCLLSVRMQKGPGTPIKALPAQPVHHVGEMDNTSMLTLIHSLGITVVANAANMVLTLPRCVFDLLVARLF